MFKALAECASTGVPKEILSLQSHFPIHDSTWQRTASLKYYIGNPLEAQIDQLGLWPEVDRETVREAIAREILSLQTCSHVITTSSDATRYITRWYGVEPGSVSTVLPGANLDDKLVETCLDGARPRRVPERFTPQRPLRIAFIGRTWKCKRLPFLIGAAKTLLMRDRPVEIHVVGASPDEYRDYSFVRLHGEIRKDTHEERLIRCLLACDLACFPDRRESNILSAVECLRLGLPIVAALSGGLADVFAAASGAAVAISPVPWPGDIADAIEPYIDHPSLLQGLNDAAWKNRSFFSWHRAVRDLASIDLKTSQKHKEESAFKIQQDPLITFNIHV
jgi:glycosyltransferase involved in cell wall biosynthesis